MEISSVRGMMEEGEREDGTDEEFNFISATLKINEGIYIFCVAKYLSITDEPASSGSRLTVTGLLNES